MEELPTFLTDNSPLYLCHVVLEHGNIRVQDTRQRGPDGKDRPILPPKHFYVKGTHPNGFEKFCSFIEKIIQEYRDQVNKKINQYQLADYIAGHEFPGVSLRVFDPQFKPLNLSPFKQPNRESLSEKIS